MKEANRQGIPVMLSGQGGDEALCGYQKYRYFYLWQLLHKADAKFFRESVLHILNGANSFLSVDSVARYLPRTLRGQLSLTGRVGSAQFQRDFENHRPVLGAPNGVVERQKTDLINTSVPILLHSEDRNSMTHSIESRLPFLDYKLVEFAVNCPPSLKLRDGWSKWILRSALAGTLPDKIRLRKSKLGFNTPERDWVMAGLQNGHRKLWESPKLRAERFLSPERLSRECRSFVSGDPFSLPSGLLIRAIALELWARVFSVD
jgi:asparagine synthase (glutamine-hydrolysing)